mmetsp:Transcript_13912/g.18055  ORF Transcript_13912/g.18055 Transcript_13912/m.18055 type:complete len:722 (-) Transcript_13912:171-2336(-)
MVNLDDAMKSDKKGIYMGISRAKDLFFEIATVAEGDDDPSIAFTQFAQLIATILKESNSEATKKSKSTIPVPSMADLKVLFNRADVNKSNTIDEYEFIGLYKAVKEGHVKGLGDTVYSFYVRPHQLMKFGQHDYHPDTDWQDLFFDLLFVGGAYQTGNFLVAALIANDGHMLEGVFWSFAIFTCLAQQWLMKILLSARFGYSSMFHYLLDNVEFILLAFAMWHIPAKELKIAITDDASYGSSYSYGTSYSDRRYLAIGSSYSVSSQEYDIFSPLEQLKENVHGRTYGLSLCLALNSLLYCFKWLEIVTDKEATQGARTISMYQSAGYAITFVIMMVACAITVSHNSQYVVFAWMGANTAYVASMFYWVEFLAAKKQEGLLEEAGVPMNTSYFIQRVGEFCMLIIGESVLSLLALSVEPDYENYLMFGASAMMACNLYFHHFSTYPPDPSKHVLRDGTFDFASLSYSCALIYLYPFCLIHIGVCLKALLLKADHNTPMDFINWAISVGICFEYVLINFFVYIHDSSRGEERRFKPFRNQASFIAFLKSLVLKGSTLFLMLLLAGLGLKPYPMLMCCCLVLLLQSSLILFFHPKPEDEDTDLEIAQIAQMDFEYQSKKMHGSPTNGSVDNSTRSSFTNFTLGTYVKMKSLARKQLKATALSDKVAVAPLPDVGKGGVLKVSEKENGIECTQQLPHDDEEKKDPDIAAGKTFEKNNWVDDDAKE